MKAGEFCGGNACLKRTPLYVVYPLLAALSLLAMLQVYVPHFRDKRQRERLAATAPPTQQDAEPPRPGKYQPPVF